MVRFCTTQDLQTSKGTSWPYGKENSWTRFPDIITLHCTHFQRLLTWCLSKIKKTGPQNEREISIFPVSLCCHFIPLGTRLGQSGPSMFWNMLKCSQKHEACKVLAQSPQPVCRNWIVLEGSRTIRPKTLRRRKLSYSKRIAAIFSSCYLKKLKYLLYGSVASLPSPSSNIEAWPYGTSLRFASLLHLGH